MNRTKLLIAGKWTSTKFDKWIPVVNPATEQVVSKVPAATKEDVDLAVKAAQKAFPTWSSFSGQSRAHVLTKIAKEISKRKQLLTELEVIDVGKPWKEAETDIEDTIKVFQYMAKHAEQLDSKQIIQELPQQYSGRIRYQPVGVVASVVPWNYPLMTAAWKVAPALAAGCSIVLKPSEVTSLSTLELGDICMEAGLPDGVLNIVTGYGQECGEPLCTHPLINKISFTGSTAIGSRLMSLAAKDLKRITLELGGKSPIIIFDDADIDNAVEWIMTGIFYCAGQICSATSRLLVQESVYPALMEKLLAATRKRKIGNGMDHQVEMGPLVSKAQYDKVMSYIEIGKKEATLEMGGKRPEYLSSGFFIEPTIFTNVPTQSRIWNEEIFGPVLCVRSFKTEQEAIQLANDSEYGLAASVMSKNKERCDRISTQLQAGCVWINCSQPVFAETIFGGFKKSGIGRELGPSSLDAYLEAKQITEFYA